MTRIGEHFRRKNFGFYCDYDEHDLFYKTQYSKSRLIYLIYRTFMFLYQLGWFLAYYIYGGIYSPLTLANSYLFLTMWGYAINMIYFTLSFILAAIGYARRYDLMLHNSNGLRIFRSIVWLIHSIGQSGAVIITVVYWVSLAPVATPGTLTSPFNIDHHAINSLLYLIEIAVVAFPIRLLHFVYPMIFGVTYLIATLIYHGAGITSAVYPILDWQNNPGIAVAYGVGCIAGCFIIHSAFFLFHFLRIWISGKCCDNENEAVNSRRSSKAEKFSYSNSAYDSMNRTTGLPLKDYP